MAIGEASASDADAIDDLVSHMATRLRRLGSRHWREPAGEGRSVADAAYEAVVWCARREAAMDPLRPAAAPEAPPRPAYDAAIADQLAVVGRDLAMAVRDRPADASEALSTLQRFARAMRVARPED